MERSASERVFVYGTLRTGGSNAFRMDGASFVRAGRVRGRLYRIDWYPGLVLDEAAGWVLGELWEVPSAMMPALDAFEGVSAGEVEGGEYRRVRATIEPLDEADAETSPQAAWVWEWKADGDEARRMASGDWLADG